MPQPESSPVVSNSAFLRALAQQAPKGSSLWVTAFGGSPDLTDAKNWHGGPYSAATMPGRVDGWSSQNTYFSVAALKPSADGELRRRKPNFVRLLALVADDVHLEDIQGTVSYVLTTSPGKSQVGIIIDGRDEDAANLQLVGRLVTTMADKGLMRADASGNNAVRYVRLPVGQNQKPRDTGAWQHHMARWAPTVVLSLADAAAAFGVDLDALRATAATDVPGASSVLPQDDRLRVLTANVLRGDNLHDGLNQIAASLVATGMPGGAIVNMLRALMEASHAAKDERWQARYQDIPRSVSTAQEKFSRPMKPDALGYADDEAEAKAQAAQLPLLSLAELEKASQAVSWQVKTLIPADSIGMLFGGSGTFKSFIALDLALHIAHGMRWCGFKTTKGPVIYIAAEGGTGLWRRIKAWHVGRNLSWEHIDFRVVPVPLDLMKDAASVVAAAQAQGMTPALVVVDTLSQTFDGEENSANEIAAYLRSLGTAFRALWRCVVLVIHHSGHSATERPRGSSAMRANVDFLVGCFRDEKEMLATVSWVKQKDGEPPADAAFCMTKHTLGEDDDGDPITSLAARFVTDGVELEQARQQEYTSGRSGKNGALLGLIQNGMAEKELRKLFYDTLETTDPHARKMAFYRARDWATKAGFIEVAQGMVIVLKEI